MMAGPQNPLPPAGALPDAPRGNWVDRAAPEAWKPFLKLARFDRPIGAWLLLFPSGQVTVRQAQKFLVLLSLIGLGVLLRFNLFTIVLGAASLALIAIYPFSKRLTYWPQLLLGL